MSPFGANSLCTRPTAIYTAMNLQNMKFISQISVSSCTEILIKFMKEKVNWFRGQWTAVTFRMCL